MDAALRGGCCVCLRAKIEWQRGEIERADECRERFGELSESLAAMVGRAAAEERALIVAYLRALNPTWPFGMYVDAIEQGAHVAKEPE